MDSDFKELNTNHIDNYYSFTNKFESFSDINFTSLLSWSPKVFFKKDDSNLILCFEDYSSDESILTGLSSDPDDFVDALLSLKSSNTNLLIDAVPSVVIDNVKNQTLRDKFKSSDIQADYLYAPLLQTKLEGSKYSWHRRKLSIFKRSNSNVHVDIDTKMSEQEAELFGRVWTDWKEVANVKEKDAIARYIDLYKEFINQYIFKVFIDNRLQGFAMCEVINGPSKDLLIHFFKSNTSFEGLSNYLFSEIAGFAAEQSVDYINFEQDLGEHGLRYYKQKLRPDKLLMKYEAIDI